MRLEYGVAALLLLALAQTAILLWLWRQQRLLRKQVDGLWQAIAAAGTDVPTSLLVAGLGRLETKLAQVQRPAAAAPAPAPVPVERSWELARHLASAGADVEQLVSRCGLSRDEARLIVQMRTPQG